MSSINDLDNFLKKYKLFPALICVARFSNKLFIANKVFEDFQLMVNGKTYKQTISQWGLLSIAHRLILCSNDGRSRDFKYEDLLKANRIFNELKEPFWKMVT
ncbi:hypothetical protein NON20_11875 [Synechocystis sp. B12]|nr:hypothetical protein NON20_11875 [Synechocystis sp. B12]